MKTSTRLTLVILAALATQALATQIGTYRIRLALDMTDHDTAIDIVTTNVAAIWKGIPTDVEVGLYNNGAFVTDLSNLTNLTLEVYDNAARSGPAYLQKALGTNSLKGNLVETNWEGGVSTNAHAIFSLSSAETAFDLSEAINNVQQYWIVVYGITTGGQEIVCGSAVVRVHVTGAPADVVLGTSNSNFRITSGGKLQLRDDDQAKWHDVYIQGAGGVEHLIISDGE